MPDETEPMKVYEADTGVTYWVAAPDLAAAMQALLDCWKAEGGSWEGESLALDEVPRTEWPKTYNDDGEGGPNSSFADLVARQTEAAVLTCSEWP